MAGGASGYASVNAVVRVKYSTLLSTDERTRLSEAPDFPALLVQLKQTGYGAYLERVRDKEITPRRAVFQIRERLAEDSLTIIHMAPGSARPVLAQLHRSFEVNNLKAVMRGIVTGATWDRVRFVLFPLGSFSVIPAEAMLETHNVAAAVELLRGTAYYDTLSYAMRRYAAEQSLFPLEVSLDLDYWRTLWAYINRLTNQDRTEALRIVGSLMDMNNLMWAIRYRVYHHLSEEELINYTLPFGFRVHDEDVRAIAAGSDIAAVVARIYPDLRDISPLLHNPRTGLPKLELQLKRHVAEECRAAFLGDPFHIGIPLGYMVLADLEIDDLTVLIEAKSAQVPAEEFESYLVTGSVS